MSRTKFIVVLAGVLVGLPHTAVALGPYEHDEKKTETKVEQAAPREMTKAMMAKAFKNFSASLDSEEKTVHLAGVTSQECMKHFEITNTPDDASFRVEFKGGPADCLNHTKLKCEVVEGQSSCAKLSEKEGAKLDLNAMSDDVKKEADGKKIVLVAKKMSKNDPYADIPHGVQSEETTEQLTGYDVQDKKVKLLAYTSEEVLKAEEEERIKKIAAAKLKRCEKFIADCKGLPEAWKAIEYLEEHDEDADEEFISDLKLAQNKAELVKLEKKLNAIRASDHEKIEEIKEEMLKLASENEALVPDVTRILTKIATKELVDPTSLTKEARERQVATLEGLRSIMSEKDFEALEAKLDKTYFQRSIAEGAESPNFKDALSLQMAQFNAKMIESGCMNEAGQKVNSQPCMQLEATIRASDAFKEVQTMATAAGAIQQQINNRRACEQGLAKPEVCQALMQQQKPVDPSVANNTMIPNPFLAPVNTQNALTGQNQPGALPNTGVVNQTTSQNPFYTSATTQSPFTPKVDPNLSVFMGTQPTVNGQVQNQQQIVNPITNHQQIVTPPVSGFATRS